MILDGSKGLRAAVRRAFPKRAVVHRCMWHKRENVVSHLPQRDQASWRRRLQRAMDRPTYEEARAALEGLQAELEEINQSAAASLASLGDPPNPAGGELLPQVLTAEGGAPAG